MTCIEYVTITLPEPEVATIVVETVQPEVTNVTLAEGVPIPVPGPQGDPGPPGDPGDPGDPGTPATVVVESTVTLPPGSPATVTDLDPSSSNALLRFGIPQGTPGASGAESGTFRYVQSTAQDTWVIVHNLGYYPSVTVVDSSKRTVIGDVVYSVDGQQVTLQFSSAFSGEAYLS